jgi:site-specific DNA-methyltransferase (adenine-specific)
LHPATFPDQLPIDVIQCFCPPSGIVLDPFMGSGTTALASIALGRNYIGYDISKEYCELAKRRIVEEGQIYQMKIPFSE